QDHRRHQRRAGDGEEAEDGLGLQAQSHLRLNPCDRKRSVESASGTLGLAKIDTNEPNSESVPTWPPFGRVSHLRTSAASSGVTGFTSTMTPTKYVLFGSSVASGQTGSSRNVVMSASAAARAGWVRLRSPLGSRMRTR